MIESIARSQAPSELRRKFLSREILVLACSGLAEEAFFDGLEESGEWKRKRKIASNLEAMAGNLIAKRSGRERGKERGLG